MATVVRMPSVLAGATEAAIAHWLVSPGDTVAVGTPIAEIETEKALVEYAAEQAGVVGRLVLAEGESGEIGDPIAVLVASGETGGDIDAALGGRDAAKAVPEENAEPAEAVPGGAPGQVTAGGAQAATATSATGAAAAMAPGRPGGAAPGTNGHQATAAGGRVFASPLVRKLAGQRGVDLAALAGTGPNGRIVRRDLERFLAAGTAPAVPAATAAASAASAPLSGVTAGSDAEPATVRDDGLSASPAVGGGTGPAGGNLIPHTPMRRAIARRLTESKATIPHFYMTAEPVVDELLALRKRVNEALPSAGPGAVKVSVNDFVIAAAAAAFRDVPEANVTWSEEGLVAYRSVDISIAVATEAGLVTPVLRGAEGKKLSAIATETAALAQRARERKLLQHELEGGTFAVSNLGMYGTVEFSAIINPPQSGILAVGAARQQPVVAGGAVVPATVMRCTLSVDHRAIDGALAARWLAAFTTRLENPLGALI
ncbi:MAG TPA: dihydrolipoamide acetyltransferase family protein [Trebonia sp.]|nr:dihydrolipoamide acetyltransferase family protein [Trebonia sp.]